MSVKLLEYRIGIEIRIKKKKAVEKATVPIF